MAGTAIDPAMVAHGITASYVNSFRISAVADRLAVHIRNTAQKDTIEFFNLCLSLARGIDYAIANSEVPSRASDLPLLLKQVCQRKNDSLLLAAIMVLMISVKNACKKRWFSDKDTEELLTLAHEISSSFCSSGDINTEASSFLPTVSTVMSRFYPQMKMGQILASLEVKPGYGAFVIDFHISKDAKSSPDDKIRLFVAQTDNIETSSCIISPLHVNFLLNGKGVEKRTNIMTDSGPQVPTIVTQMLKYGTNILQAVGQFNGNYIILVAFMSVISTPVRPPLQDYVQPAIAALDSDSEIIEGPSRISLNCPISFRRIQTPVKGQSCKHLQCFDFDNFMDINTRRPSWRCPHCNQYICYTDIRIDQNMVKVLKEVGDNVANVIISADGSWKAIMENDDDTDQPHEKTPVSKQDGPTHQEQTSLSNAPPGILDLTEGDDEMGEVGTFENEDRKPFSVNFQSQSYVVNPTINPSMNNTREIIQNTASHVEDDFWSGIYLSTYGSGAPSSSDTQVIGGISESTALVTTSATQNQLSSPSNLQLQQFGNSDLSNEYGRFPSIPRHLNRTPIAIQALPAQAQVPQQRSRTSLNIHDGPSVDSQTSPALPLIGDGFNMVSSDVERQQLFARSHLNPLQVPRVTSSSLQQLLGSQSPFLNSNLPAQQIGGLRTPSQLPTAHRSSPTLSTEPQNLHRQQSLLNLRMPHTMSQPPTLARSSIQPSSQFPRTQIHQGGARTWVDQPSGIASSSQHARFSAAAQRTAQMARHPPPIPVSIPTSRSSSPSIPVSIQTPRSSSPSPSIPVLIPTSRSSSPSIPVSTPTSRSSSSPFLVNADASRTSMGDGSVDPAAEQNWRPTGRMRGSLSGRAYSDALNQFIIQPTQPVQAPRSLSNTIPPPPGIIPPQLHTPTTNSINVNAPQGVNYPSTEPSCTSGGVGPK